MIRSGRAAALVGGGVECSGCRGNRSAFLVRPGSTAAKPLGQALHAASAGAGRGFWLLQKKGGGRCSIRRVEADGTARLARPSRCAGVLGGQTPPGLIVNASVLVDPTDGRTLLRASGMLAATARHVLRRPVKGSLVLQDVRGGAPQTLRWPSSYGYVNGAVVAPGDRRIAVFFVSGPVDQHIDFWLFDTSTQRFQHVPGFPTAAALKRTSFTWTADGRLVILTHKNARDALIVWRPGDRRAASSYIDLPGREAGIHGIAAW